MLLLLSESGFAPDGGDLVRLASAEEPVWLIELLYDEQCGDKNDLLPWFLSELHSGITISRSSGGLFLPVVSSWLFAGAGERFHHVGWPSS